jgi:hypothetical protein
MFYKYTVEINDEYGNSIKLEYISYIFRNIIYSYFKIKTSNIAQSCIRKFLGSRIYTR